MTVDPLTDSTPGAGRIPAAPAHGIFLLGEGRSMALLRERLVQARSSWYVAAEAATLAGALLKLRQCTCDVVVLDIGWRDRATVELLRQCTRARIAAISPTEEPEAVDRALAVGVDAVLCCGTDTPGGDALLLALGRVLHGATGLSVEATRALFVRAARRAAAHAGHPRARLGFYGNPPTPA